MILFFKQVVSILLAVTTLSASSMLSAISPKLAEKVYPDLFENGIHAVTTDELADALNSISLSDDAFEVTFDDLSVELLNYVNENSNLNVERILSNLPDLNKGINTAIKVFGVNTSEFKDKMYSVRDKMYSEGKYTQGHIFYLIGAYFSGFEKCDISLCDRGNGNYEFVLDITFINGETEKLNTSIYYNPEKGELFGKSGKGVLDLGFDFSVDDVVIFATVNCWMRNFGFCLSYDAFSYLTPFYFYNTRRYKFNYDGKDYMIQLWKGNYLITNGAEAGIYTRSLPFGTIYDCASEEDMMPMEMSLYHDDELIFTREEQPHWWINGFKPSNTLYPAASLTIDLKVTMKSEEMAQAFVESVENNRYGDASITVDGANVHLVW